MDLQLNGRTALVTGATAGIGLEIARTLATEGARVVITGRDRAKLDSAIAVVKASGGSDIMGILADAASAEGAALIGKTEPSFDILINWSHLFDVNVMSGVRLSRAYLPGMLERNWGRIVFISSEAGLAIPQDMIHYATSKTAQLSLSRGLAQMTRGTNVTVNAVLPGPTRSEGIEAFLRSQASDPTAPIKKIESEFFATARSASILQRMVEAEEVANLVAYLASPRSSATNGAALRAEGGLVNTIA
jgi:NAD(P)-dependent dehydrogenase (short-subunit alcohol dehydrogenase family)